MAELFELESTVFSGTLPLACACILAGLSMGTAALLVWRLIHGERGHWESFEKSRRESLRAVDSTYELAELLVDELVGFFPADSRLDQLAHHLRLALPNAPWRPAEFTSAKIIEALFCGVVIFAFIALVGMPMLGVVLAIGTTLCYPVLARNSVVSRSRARLKSIKLRLPFAIDQISLMMEAGAGFEDSLRTVVADNRNHALSQELAEVLRQMSLGRPRSHALTEFRDRMSDEDVSEVVFAIIKGEELGTPLSSILREQANQMRIKRSQWGEKAAAEAEVQMVFPGMITMVACLLVIVAPILLPVVVTFLEG